MQDFVINRKTIMQSLYASSFAGRYATHMLILENTQLVRLRVV